MTATFGLDFGTTNSLISVIRVDNETRRKRPFSFLTDDRPHPSVVWYSGSQPIVGRHAMDHLGQLGLGVLGDFVRSPKMFLGSSSDIYVAEVPRRPADVAAEVLKHVRNDALERAYGNNTFERAVITIPVTMAGMARAELREAAHQAGITIHQFVHEPLAALYGYLRGRPDFRKDLASLEGRLILVFDWGGGTLDLTLCQIRAGCLTQILNLGNREVGGDYFDLRIRQLVRHKHEALYPQTDWTKVHANAEARLVHECEDAKIRLSSRHNTTLFVPDLIASSGPEKDLDVVVTRTELEEVVHDLILGGLNQIEDLIRSAGLQRSAIEFCLATGGMISMPAIQNGLRELFGMSQLRLPKNSASIIAEGAAWIANDQIGLQLSKPIEILHADNSYIEIVPAGTELPLEGQVISVTIDMYCVDPSDGFAKFLFARPTWPGRDSQRENRIPYGHITLPVDQTSRPLFERLKVQIDIDHNLIADIRARSELRRQRRRVSIHDLEFGLSLQEAVQDD